VEEVELGVGSGEVLLGSGDVVRGAGDVVRAGADDIVLGPSDWLAVPDDECATEIAMIVAIVVIMAARPPVSQKKRYGCLFSE